MDRTADGMGDGRVAVPPVVRRWDGERFTLEFLRTFEMPCPACGYNVHRVSEARCPECGLKLEVRVVTTERISWAWVVGMVVASLAAGIGLLVLAVVVREGWPRGGSWNFERVALNVVMPFFLLMMGAPVVGLLIRRWFGRWLKGLQWGIVGAMGLVVILMVALFAAVIARG